MANIKTYDADKLNELKKKIEARCETLDEICRNLTLAGCKGSTESAMREQLLQCRAELRLIKHIENNFEDNFLIS